MLAAGDFHGKTVVDVASGKSSVERDDTSATRNAQEV